MKMRHAFFADFPLYDKDVIAEYIDVLSRKKFKIDVEDIQDIIGFIEEVGINSSRLSYTESLPDETDRVFYEITLSADGSFLVTGNLKHYPREPRVVTPAEMLAIIETLQS